MSKMWQMYLDYDICTAIASPLVKFVGEGMGVQHFVLIGWHQPHKGVTHLSKEVENPYSIDHHHEPCVLHEEGRKVL